MADQDTIGQPKCTETGFREPFVELPPDRLPAPVTPEARRREALSHALNHLIETQRGDMVERFAESFQQFRDGLERVYKLLSHNYEGHWDERVSDLQVVVHHLEWLMERRLEQIGTLRYHIAKLAPSGLASKILHESAVATKGHREPATAVAPRCNGDEHVYQVGEPRCDCGKVAVQVVPRNSTGG